MLTRCPHTSPQRNVPKINLTALSCSSSSSSNSGSFSSFSKQESKLLVPESDKSKTGIEGKAKQFIQQNRQDELVELIPRKPPSNSCLSYPSHIFSIKSDVRLSWFYPLPSPITSQHAPSLPTPFFLHSSLYPCVHPSIPDICSMAFM